jgi:4-hydroxybenzoate polyprenyltransferase
MTGKPGGPAVKQHYTGWQIFYGLLRATHLFPNIMMALATLLFGFIAANGRPDPLVLARTWLVVMSGHAAVGLLNDYLDRERDAIAQPDKPIPAGLVSARLVLNLVIGLLALKLVLLLTLAPGPALLAFAMTTSGLLYDLLYKDSYLSWVPYLLSFPTYVLFVWAAMGRFDPILLWIYPPALLLTVGLNLANALPDIETDLAQHASRGLAHRLGLRYSLAACGLLFTLAPLLCLLLSLFLPVNRAWAWPGLGLALLVVLAGWVIYYRATDKTAGLELVGKLSGVAAFFTALSWLSALTLL